jgi:hypothetical protein
VTWRKLDCLKPSLQKMESCIYRKTRLKPVPALLDGWDIRRATSGGQERCPVRAFKETNGPPKSRCHVRQGRTWDRLTGASPRATEAP